MAAYMQVCFGVEYVVIQGAKSCHKWGRGEGIANSSLVFDERRAWCDETGVVQE